MLEDGIIESSVSDWASPIVFVKKKDKSMRLTMCRLNPSQAAGDYSRPASLTSPEVGVKIRR